MERYILPAEFEELPKKQQEVFLHVKKFKEDGGFLAGIYCGFTPLEVLDAAGVHSVNLYSVNDEAITIAERDLPKNLCPLVKSSYGMAISNKCPYLYFADIAVGQTTCDGKKKMYEMIDALKEVYVMQIPQGVDREYSKLMFRDEVVRFIKYIERRFGIRITDEKLRDASIVRNSLRQAKLSFMELQKNCPPPLSSLELYQLSEDSKLHFSLEKRIENIQSITKHAQTQWTINGTNECNMAKRILITGCPIADNVEKLADAIENNGGSVVCYENCTGFKSVHLQVDTKADDIIAAIAEKYMEIGCAVMSPNIYREKTLLDSVKEFSADGVIDIILQACHPYSVERRAMKKLCSQFDIPYMALETNYGLSDKSQIETRVAAFIERI